MAAKTIDIALTKAVDDSYRILVGVRRSDWAKQIYRDFPASGIFVLTDATVHTLYGKSFLHTLNAVGARPSSIVVPPSENSKTRGMKARIEDRLLALRADRDALIIALGGGMIGDLAGFVAATLHRGVRYVQIPTTLLAQVDSSIGGKVAVNHPKGKNLIGAVYPPEAVYIDPSTLLTLPREQFSAGLAEVVKYGAILDRSFFSFLERDVPKILRRDKATMTKIITRCCELKKRVVQEDERETSYRRILNFGHTLGHAIESASRFRLSHGHAVAIGMALEGRIALSQGILPERALARLLTLLRALHLPTELPGGMPTSDIVRRTRHDKKFRQGFVRYTLIEAIGRGIIDVPLSENDVVRDLNS